MLKLESTELTSIQNEIKVEKPYNSHIIENANNLLYKLNRTSVETALLFVNCVKIMRLTKNQKVLSEIGKFKFIEKLILDIERFYKGGLGKSDAEYRIIKTLQENRMIIEDFIIFTQQAIKLFSITEKDKVDVGQEGLDLIKKFNL